MLSENDVRQLEFEKRTVLILVLMEYALWGFSWVSERRLLQVLILVLMEYALWVVN